jgi:hypothetical protein
MLTIHRAERADRLVEALASVIVDPLDDPPAADRQQPFARRCPRRSVDERLWSLRRG